MAYTAKQDARQGRFDTVRFRDLAMRKPRSVAALGVVVGGHNDGSPADMRRIPTPPKDFNVMQHELLTDGPPPDAPETSNLMQLRFGTGLGNTFVPDECDTLGIVTHGHSRVTQLIAELFRRAGELAANAKQVNDSQQATLADVDALQHQVAILFDENKALRQDIQALMLRRAG